MTTNNRKEDIKKAMENEVTQEIITMDATQKHLMAQEDMGSYYSMKAKTQEEKIILFNALNSPSKRVEDCINMEIAVKHIFAEIVEIVDDKSGEVIRAPRVVILDDKNESYACVSLGMFSALKRTFQIFGEPEEWEKPLKFKVVQKATRNGSNKVLTLELIG